jgi:hypothetical protein
MHLCSVQNKVNFVVWQKEGLTSAVSVMGCSRCRGVATIISDGGNDNCGSIGVDVTPGDDNCDKIKLRLSPRGE